LFVIINLTLVMVAVGVVSIGLTAVDGGVGTIGVVLAVGVSVSLSAVDLSVGGIGTITVGDGGGDDGLLVDGVHVSVGGGDRGNSLDHGGVGVVAAIAVGGAVGVGVEAIAVSVGSVSNDSGLSGGDGHEEGDANLS
jgi:hypothetical protein